MRRRFSFLPLISAFFLTFASCADKFCENNGFVWGTSYHIVYSAGDAGGRDLHDSVRAVMAAIDRSLSVFDEASLVSAVNAGTTDSVDALFADVFATSRRVWKASAGAFDPTVGPLVDLWGFGPGGSADREPSDSMIAAAKALVGLGGCSVSGGRVVKKNPGTRFDFSSIAKGYGVDLVARMLARNGCRDYMVEIGGEIALRGHNPRDRRWHIQIDAPVEPDSASASVHERLMVLPFGPEPVAIASSGDYRNRRSFGEENGGGKSYGHTIDPLTGRPRGGRTLGVTVIAPDCILADALATAGMAMDADSAMAMIKAFPRTEALMVLADSAGGFVVLASPGWPAEGAAIR